MNGDIRPPRRPQNSSLSVDPPTVMPPALNAPKSPEEPPPSEQPPARHKKKRVLMWVAGSVVGALLVGSLLAGLWYMQALRPVGSQNAGMVRVKVVVGSSPLEIAHLLKQDGLIRSETAFIFYTRLTGTRSKLQAGTYRISPGESTADVVAHLVAGRTDHFTLTFYPGATLTDHSSTPENKKTDVETVLRRAGYAQAEITAAFHRTYEGPLFAGKPASADLEGYVYGETYDFDSSATVSDILQRTFDEFYLKLQQKNLIAGFQKQNLSLYQAITLASIIQREVSSPADQKQVAQVFFKRLQMGMPLGSDITAYYGADKAGLPRSVTTDTPYNTRIHTGLPPGPVDSPGLTALEAVASPAPGDYLYFLSGDDNVTYFAKDEAGHEANIANHCKIKCAVQ